MYICFFFTFSVDYFSFQIIQCPEVKTQRGRFGRHRWRTYVGHISAKEYDKTSMVATWRPTSMADICRPYVRHMSVIEVCRPYVRYRCRQNILLWVYMVTLRFFSLTYFRWSNISSSLILSSTPWRTYCRHLIWNINYSQSDGGKFQRPRSKQLGVYVRTWKKFAFHTLAKDMSLNRGTIYFQLGLRPCIISSFLL